MQEEMKLETETKSPKSMEKSTLIDRARAIAWKNHVPIEHAMIWARMPIHGGIDGAS